MDTTDGNSASLARLIRSRKQIDSDAQLLSNRIKLLRLEEQKTLKKIQDTRRKTKTVLQAQRRERAQVHLFDQLSAQRQRMLSQKHERIAQLREGQRLQHQQSLESLVKKKRRQALAVKTQILSDLQKKSDLQIRLQEVNWARVKGMQQDRQEAKLRANSQRGWKRALVAEVRYERFAEEDRKAKAREQAVMDMELVEMELIERLKTTQRMQQEADEQLETVLSQRPRSLGGTR